MKAIVVQTLEQFDELQGRIHQQLKNNLPGYNETKGFLRWAEPTIQNTTTGYYACPIKDDGLRGAIILAFALTETEKNNIVELDQNDETWFPQPEEELI
jgi:NOL1/NOP2/fmu family ribosome biogenesis protein